ncbi:MAG: hypothetical protein K2H47_12055 [Muribaculaceae bacterium]|nr:hypothetical protein [Muribaculaceae bacterium]
MKRIINKILLSVLSAFLITGSMYAATPEEIEANMDRIKLDERFIYAENFSEDMDTAYENALSELIATINELESISSVNELRIKEKKAPLKVETEVLKPFVKELRYSTGTRNTVFLYLPLAWIKITADRTGVEVVPSENDMTAQTSPSQSTSATDSGRPEPVKPTSSTQLPPMNDILKTLCAQDNWVEIKGLLIEYKNQKKITTGTVKTASEVPEDAYSILLDNRGSILAILSPKTSGDRINYKTNLSDDESNHKDCIAIIWYR